MHTQAIGNRGVGIFDDIVEHGRHQALVIQFQASKDSSNRQGMGNIAIAAFAHLPFVGLFGIIVGSSHLIDAIGIKIRAEFIGQHINRCLCRHRASVGIINARDKKTRMQAFGSFRRSSSHAYRYTIKPQEQISMLWTGNQKIFPSSATFNLIRRHPQ